MPQKNKIIEVTNLLKTVDRLLQVELLKKIKNDNKINISELLPYDNKIFPFIYKDEIFLFDQGESRNNSLIEEIKENKQLYEDTKITIFYTGKPRYIQHKTTKINYVDIKNYKIELDFDSIIKNCEKIAINKNKKELTKVYKYKTLYQEILDENGHNTKKKVNLENTVKTIIDKTICFSIPSSLNDPFECTYVNNSIVPFAIAFYIAQQENKKKAISNSTSVSGKYDKLTERYNDNIPLDDYLKRCIDDKIIDKKYEQGIKDLLIREVKPDDFCRIFSTSKKYDDLLMWSYYADSNRGICIEYNKNNIIEKAVEQGDLIIGEVEYSNRRMKNGDFQIYSYFMSEKTVLDLFMINTFFRKSNNWKHEEEYRFVLINKDSVEEQNTKEGKPTIVNGIEWNYIYLGVNCDINQFIKVSIEDSKKQKYEKLHLDSNEYALVKNNL